MWFLHRFITCNNPPRAGLFSLSPRSRKTFSKRGIWDKQPQVEIEARLLHYYTSIFSSTQVTVSLHRLTHYTCLYSRLLKTAPVSAKLAHISCHIWHCTDILNPSGVAITKWLHQRGKKWLSQPPPLASLIPMWPLRNGIPTPKL